MAGNNVKEAVATSEPGLAQTELNVDQFPNISKLRQLLIALVEEQRKRNPAVAFVTDSEFITLPAFDQLVEKCKLLNTRSTTSAPITDSQLLIILKPIVTELWSARSAEDALRAAKFEDTKVVLTEHAERVECTYSERYGALYFHFDATSRISGSSISVVITVGQNFDTTVAVSIMEPHTEAQLAEICNEIGVPVLMNLIDTNTNDRQPTGKFKPKKYSLDFPASSEVSIKILAQLNTTVGHILSKSNNWGTLKKNIKFVDLEKSISLLKNAVGSNLLPTNFERFTNVLNEVARQYTLEVNPELLEQRNQLLAYFIVNPEKIAWTLLMVLAEAAVVKAIVWDAIQTESLGGEDVIFASFLCAYILFAYREIVRNDSRI
jgi:hypothetical protein